MSPRPAFIATLFVMALLIGCAVAAIRQARGHGPYENWHPPNNAQTSCCNNADCRPTRAYVDDDGHWRAWNGSAWLVVPWDRVLPTNFAGDGRSHLCEKQGFVYCFTPGEVRG